jgi:hypothetical protein
MMEGLKISPTVTLNARVCETYPQVAQACVDAGWELNAHGFDQVPMHKLDDQKAVIDKSVAIIGKFWGKPPRGWFGPGLTQTFDTLDHLSAAGIEYIGDWVLDDEPVTLRTTHKPVVALPYNFELHDDGAEAPPLGRDVSPHHGPVRVALCRVGEPAEVHVDRHAPVPLGRAAPHRPRAARLRGDPEPSRRRGVGRGEDSRLASGARRIAVVGRTVQ